MKILTFGIRTGIMKYPVQDAQKLTLCTEIITADDLKSGRQSSKMGVYEIGSRRCGNESALII